MALTPLTFTPEIGYNDAVTFPDPATEAAARAQIQELHDQTKDYMVALIAELLSTAVGKGASTIGLQDSAGRFTAANVEAALAELAGSGRTTETLKSLADLISTHTADLITDSNGVHGLKIEEGTWTPDIRGAFVAGSNSYTARSGRYKKIGDIVIASFYISMSAKDAAMSGNALIGGFPFTCANVGNEQFPVNMANYAYLTGLSSGIVNGNISANQVTATIGNVMPTVTAALTNANITNTTYLAGSVIYKIQ